MVPGTTATEVGLTATSATITLTDDNKTTTTPTDDVDSAELSISGPSANVAEGSDAEFEVTLSAGVSKEVQVGWTATGNTDDYAPTFGTVTFAAGSAAGATQEIDIAVEDDDLSEGEESFTVTLGAVGGDLSDQVTVNSTANSAQATIAASDPITVNISGPTSVDEGEATTAYTVSLSPDGVTPTADLTVSYATSDGTAEAGSDYTAKSGTLTFTNAAAGSQTFTVQTTEDTFDETDETFTVTLSNLSGGGGTSSLDSSNTSVETTITDDDAAVTGIALSASPDTLGEDDAATSITVTATLEGGSTLPGDTVVTIGTLAGTAEAGTEKDYTATSLGNITISADSTSGTASFTVTPTDDQVVEGDETITVPGSTTVTGLTVTSATITLTDDDGSTTDPEEEDDVDSAEISISGPSASVVEGSDAVFTVTLSAAVDAEVQVAWSAPLGTDAAESSDLSATSGTVTFAANSAANATQSITITATDDALSEDAESFTVTLGAITSDLSSQVSLKSGSGSATATIAESDPITVDISGPTAVNEGDTTGNYTVSLSPSGVTPTADLTVSYGTSDGTAEAGSDYTAKSGTLTFTNAAAGSQTFTVQTTGDTRDEGTGETFTVTISSPSGGGGPAPSLGTAKSVTTTITDDDTDPTGITLSAVPNTLGEDDSATIITVTATLNNSGTFAANTVVTLSRGGTATAGTGNDYTATALDSVTIPANSTSGSGTFTLTPIDDAVVEGDETITFSGTAGTLSVSDTTITLTDDNKTTTTPTDDKDTAEISISGPEDDSVAEGGDASFTVTLSAAVSREVQVAWSAPVGTDAAEGADLSATAGTVTIAAGSTTGSITITATDDALSEEAESFTVTLGTITSDLSDQVSLKSGASSDTATIAASDPITVGITGPSNVDEGDATTEYTVSLSGGTPTADLTVSYATSDGTAEAGSDYTAKSDTLTFTNTAAGSQTFTIQTTEDTRDEGTGETFTVTISSPAGGGGATPTLGTASVTTTITDDDAAVTGIALSASPNTLGEDDAATSITITATLEGGSTLPGDTLVTIGTLAGTAEAGTEKDYTATSLGNITISADSTSGTASFTVTPTDDQVVEGDETITVPGSTTVTGLTVTSATITLTDDDGSTTDPEEEDDVDSAEISISGPSASVVEGSDAVFTVTLSAAVDAEVQVAWSAPLGTDAAESSDLSATSGTVTFAANSAANATQSITITATDDALSEEAESFTVTLGAITSDLSSQVSLKSGSGSATATIAESDPITVDISGPTAVNEGDTTGNYTVSLSPSGVTPTADLTVSYGTSDGTAEAGSDYTAASGTLTFSQTAADSQTFTVQTTDDTFDETDETFTVTLSNLSGGRGTSSLATSKSVTTTITDDDAAVTGIALSASPNTLGEDDAATSITITATLEGGSTLPGDTLVTIGTLAGTAEAGTEKDYTATSLGNITISADSTSGTASFTVTPTDDQVVEGDETIVVPGSTTDEVGLTVTSATITLTDDNKTTTTPTDDVDSAEISISGPSANVAEGSDAEFEVTLSAAVAKQVQVAWSAPLGTDAAEGADLSATAGTVTIAAGSTTGSITITATDDALSETAESFTVTLGAITSDLSSQVSLKSGSSSATATIAESDPITVGLTGPATAGEGKATSNYTVALSPSGVTPTADLTVSYATSDGTATAGTDYTAASGTLTFTASNHGDKTFTVQTTEDTFDETNETFTVTLSNLSGGGGTSRLDSSNTSVETTITDDDAAVTGIALSANPNTLGEDDAATSITITATLEGGSTLPGDTLVTIGTLTGTAEAGTEKDYTATSLGNITISANSTSGTESFTVTPVDDAVVEGDETIVVPGSTTDEVGLTVTSATITLTDDNKSTSDRRDEDDKDQAEISISGPSASVTEGDDASFTVTLSAAVDAEVQVAWSAPLGTDAAESSDLSDTSDTVTFAANSAAGATQTITVGTEDDTLSEGEESFTVTLGAITSDLSSQVSLKSGGSSATATISASDPITVSLTGPSEVDEGDTTTDYTVSLSGVRPTADLTVSYEATDGTATAGSDYTAVSATTLTFTASDHGDKTFTVSTTDDTFDETDETFTVTLSNLSGGGGTSSLDSSNTSVETTITDDDAAVTGIALSANPNTLGEDDAATSITITATLEGGSTLPGDTLVTIGTLAGTATVGTGNDYTATSLGNITISADSTSGTASFTVTPADDVVVEGDETIIVSGSTSTQVGLDVSDAIITLTDGDNSTTTPGDKDSAELSISGPTGNVSESDDATFTVTLSQAVAAEVQVDWSAPLAADAAEGSDLSATSGTVTFAANSAAGASQSITITATDDDLSEGAESFTVTLGTITSDLASQVSLGTAESAEATIAESDPITVGITGPDSVNEGDTATFTISLSGGTPTENLTVDYATSDGTATEGEDYTAKSGTFTFTQTDAGDKTVEVQTTDDIISEGSESFNFELSTLKGGGGPDAHLSSGSTNTIINDDDFLTWCRQNYERVIDWWKQGECRRWGVWQQYTGATI